MSEEFINIYGMQKQNLLRLTMCGGSSEWYNYLVFFDDRHEQESIYIEDRTGQHILRNKKVIIGTDDNTDKIKIVDDNYEPAEDEYYLYNY